MCYNTPKEVIFCQKIICCYIYNEIYYGDVLLQKTYIAVFTGKQIPNRIVQMLLIRKPLYGVNIKGKVIFNIKSAVFERNTLKTIEKAIRLCYTQIDRLSNGVTVCQK